jgi:hypothetical protein
LSPGLSYQLSNIKYQISNIKYPDIYPLYFLILSVMTQIQSASSDQFLNLQMGHVAPSSTICQSILSILESKYAPMVSESCPQNLQSPVCGQLCPALFSYDPFRRPVENRVLMLTFITKTVLHSSKPEIQLLRISHLIRILFNLEKWSHRPIGNTKLTVLLPLDFL